MTGPALWGQFDKARLEAAKETPALAKNIKDFRFYDLRAKAADDITGGHGEKAGSELLGHESVKTVKRHYLLRRKIATPIK